MENFSAFLFDCDGTIADSMPLHHVAWNRALSKWGGHLPENLHYEWAGRPTKRIIELLNEMQGLQVPVAEAVEAKEAAYLDILHTVEGVPSILEIIEKYSGKIPFAVVSGSPRDSVRKTLAHLDLLKHFKIVLGAEDYAHGKPAPDCFLEAARLLGVAPETCLVFEDADLGVQAAEAAGMKWAKVDPRKGTLQLP